MRYISPVQKICFLKWGSSKKMKEFSDVGRKPLTSNLFTDLVHILHIMIILSLSVHKPNNSRRNNIQSKCKLKYCKTQIAETCQDYIATYKYFVNQIDG